MFRRLSSRIRKLGASIALLSAEMTIVVCLFVCALVVFVFTVRRVFVLDRTQFDKRAFNWLESHISHRNTEVMEFFTFLGTHLFLIPANLSLIAYFLFFKKNRWYSIKIPAIALTSVGLMFVLKNIFNRPRPDNPLLRAARASAFPVVMP